ncbi:glucitol operon activator protein [Nocardioides sp. BE266]|uniref:transcriptional regulator GutM n=1 Tax=Nocardioides sp. BE266 TaxID=2817725 RepID=UPI002861064F|nr:transcriptional regulator GutM [Nocardioides sp. BE266]MDR7255534.1 glucitol operon activator protein [Nocardioides sp. BE266]
MNPGFIIIGALVAGWLVQIYFTYRQSMAFNDDVRRLRGSGTVSVGVGGNRYKGRRAFVAIAVDDAGVVRDAITLGGLTTFARAKSLPGLLGVKVSVLRGDRALPHVSPSQRLAARQAAELYGAARTTVRATV